MFPVATDTPLNQAQIIAATKLLLRIAHVDGAKTAEEVTLIRQFYEGSVNGDHQAPAFAALEQQYADGDVAATDFPDAAHRDLLIALSLMLSYADGALSDEELAAVRAAAKQLEVADDRVDTLLAQVKDQMLAQLARLPDAGSVAVVAGELG